MGLCKLSFGGHGSGDAFMFLTFKVCPWLAFICHRFILSLNVMANLFLSLLFTKCWRSSNVVPRKDRWRKMRSTSTNPSILAKGNKTSSIRTKMRPIDVRMKEISWIFLNLLEFTWIYMQFYEFPDVL